MLIMLVLLTVWCAFFAIQSSHLLHATLWLAGSGALTAILLYAMGAWTVAIVELSVGTGLVTVLIVFAITMIGNQQESIAVKRFPLAIVLLTLLFVLLFTVPLLSLDLIEQQTLTQNLWEHRELDMLIQITLIFSGVTDVLGLLRTGATHTHASSQSIKQHDMKEQEASA